MASRRRSQQPGLNSRRHNQDLHIKAIMHWHSDQQAIRAPDLSPTCSPMAQASSEGITNLMGRMDLRSASESTSTSNDDGKDRGRISTSRVLLDVPMPTVTSSATPHSYQRILCHRVEELDLQKNGQFDVGVFPPIFVHDVLMLPGSMAALLDPGPKTGTFKVHSRAFPALLSGHTARIHAESLQPRLMPTQDSRDYVKGIVVLGMSRQERTLVHKHYRNHGRRESKQIEIEVIVGYRKDAAESKSTSQPGRARANENPNGMVPPPQQRIREPILERRSIRAYVWVWKDRKKPEAIADLVPDREWTLEDHLEGNLEDTRTTLRVENSARGDEDEDGYIGREIKVREIKPEKREQVYGGAGGLDWERDTTVDFTGW